MLSKKIVDNSLLIIILVFFSILYYFTLYPGVGGRVNFGDSAKFQFLWAIDGVPHSTGYPQYTFITKMLAQYLPFFEPWKRVSILSILFGVATLAVLYKTALSLTKDSFISLLPVITLGSCYVFLESINRTRGLYIEFFLSSFNNFLFNKLLLHP